MRFKKVLFLVCFAFAGAISADDSWRISNNTVPINYDVHINTTFEKEDFAFNGTVVIKLKIENFPDEIQFHKNLLDIQNILLRSPSGQEINTTLTASKTLENQIYGLKFNSGVHKEIGTYSLTIKYNGTLRDDKLGFYRSNYTNAKGETVWLAATQFAPTYARSAFPCLDEPNKKATFDIKLTYPADKFAISNMPNSSFVVK